MLDTSLKPDADRLTAEAKKRILELEKTCVESSRALQLANEYVRDQEKSDARENADLQLARENQAKANHKYMTESKSLAALRCGIEGYAPSGVIELGTTVELRLTSVNGAAPNFSLNHFIVKVVEHDAGDAQRSFIAKDCAVGCALMGRIAGDDITISTPMGVLNYHIERVY